VEDIVVFQMKDVKCGQFSSWFLLHKTFYRENTILNKQSSKKKWDGYLIHPETKKPFVVNGTQRITL